MNDTDKQFYELLNRGHSAAWERDWEQAKSWYSQALEVKPDHPTALSNLGLAFFELGQYDEALKLYLFLAKKSHDDPVSFEKLGQIYEEKEEFEKAAKYALYAGELYIKTREINRAIENWVRATRNDPQNLQAHSKLAFVYKRLGQKEQAVRELLIMASLYQHGSDSQNAYRAIEYALALMPENQEAKRAIEMLKAGKTLLYPNQSTENLAEDNAQIASSRKKTVNDSQPQSVDPIQEAHENGLKALADILFEESVLDNQQSGPISRRGIHAIVKGARNLISRPIDHTRIIIHLKQALEMQTTGDNLHAAEEIEKAINAGLSSPAAIFELGYLRAKEARLESALRTLQKAANHQEYILATHLLLGQIYQKMERISDASIEYLYALRQADILTVSTTQAKDINQLYDPIIETVRQESSLEAKSQICENIVNLLVRSDWRNHLRKVREQLKSRATNGQTLPLAEMVTPTEGGNLVESLGSVYELVSAGYSRSAMEEAFYILQFTPGYLPLHIYLGDMLYKQGQTEEAINKYIVVAKTYEARNEPDRAVEVYHRVIELAPMADTPRLGLISQLITMGKNDDAITEIMNLANVYYHLADLEKARSALQDALKIVDQGNIPLLKHVRILHLLADIDIQSLNWRQALHLFEQIRGIAPDDEKARYRIIDLNMRLEQKELALAELDSYLVYLERNGKTKQAVTFLNRLQQENPIWTDWVTPRLGGLNA